jgi:hypothetical protein
MRTRTCRPVVLVFLCLLIPACLSAQQSPSPSAPPPPKNDPQAVALVQRTLGVLTGVASVSDITLTGTARRIAGSDDETGTVTLKATAAGDSRVDLSFPSGNRSEIRNHAAAPLPVTLPRGVTLPAAVTSQPRPAGVWSGPDGARHAIGELHLRDESCQQQRRPPRHNDRRSRVGDV